jgi:hypothetical protein
MIVHSYASLPMGQIGVANPEGDDWGLIGSWLHQDFFRTQNPPMAEGRAAWMDR